MSEFIFEDWVICPDDPTATLERINQYKDYYKIKYDICRRVKPKVIAEIGVRAGYSGWTFLQAAPDAKYYGFDANNGTHGGQGGQTGVFKKWALNILSEYDAQYTEVDTQKVTSLECSDVDLFHVDGDHTYLGVQNDLDLAYECLADNGFILVDDIDYIPEVKRGVVAWLKQNDLKAEYIKSLRGEYLIKKCV